MKSSSPLPRPTTLVSPVTIGTPARAAARARRLDHAAQVGERQALLEDEGERQRERPRAADREVVDRAVDRELADVAAGEEDRRDDVGVGGEGDARAVDAATIA